MNPYREHMIAWYGDAEIWQAKYREACRQYAEGEIRYAVFLAVLHGLGFRGQELTAEESLNRTEKSRT